MRTAQQDELLVAIQDTVAAQEVVMRGCDGERSEERVNRARSRLVTLESGVDLAYECDSLVQATYKLLACQAMYLRRRRSGNIPSALKVRLSTLEAEVRRLEDEEMCV